MRRSFAGAEYTPPRDPHRLDASRVADVGPRVLREHHEVGPGPGLDGSHRARDTHAARGVAGRGEQSLRGREPRLDHPLELEVLEVALEASGWPGVGAHGDPHAG